MPYAASETDGNFYQLLHLLLRREQEEELAERRGAVRYPFPTIQRIAPRRGPSFPEDREFVEVQCCDLSRTGFSFILPKRPDFTSLVAAFGSPPEVSYLAAEVSHYESVLVYACGFVKCIQNQADHASGRSPGSKTATLMVRVGCRFIEWLEKPTASDGQRTADIGE